MSTVEIVFTGLMALRPEPTSNKGPHWRLGIFHGVPDHDLSIQLIKKRGSEITLEPFYLPDNTTDIEFKVVRSQNVTVNTASLGPLFHLDGPNRHNRQLRKRSNPQASIQSFRTFVSEFSTGLEDRVCVTQGPSGAPVQSETTIHSQIRARVVLASGSRGVLSCGRHRRDDILPQDGTDYVITVTNLPSSTDLDQSHAGHDGDEGHFKLYYRFWDVPPNEQFDIFGACPRLLGESSDAGEKARQRLQERILSGIGSRPCIPPLVTQSDLE